jgi:hypothetical protein
LSRKVPAPVEDRALDVSTPSIAATRSRTAPVDGGGVAVSLSCAASDGVTTMSVRAYDGREDLVEARVDRVREDVRPRDQRDAERHGQRGQEQAGLAGQEPAERDATHGGP